MLLPLVVAVSFGALNALLDNASGAPWSPLGAVLNAGCAWAGLAVWTGWWVRTPVRAAVAGWAAGTVGLASFYVVAALVRGTGLSLDRFAFWSAVALVCLPLGLVGSRARDAGPVGTLARLVVPVGAVTEVLVHPPGGAGVRWTIGIAAGLALVLTAWRRAASGRSPHPPPHRPRP